MRIKIASKLHPFSHAKGVFCLIPGSLCQVEIFPTLIRYLDREMALPFTGPIKDFTVVLDLERGCIVVFGHAMNGYMHYYISYQEGNVVVDFNKAPALHQKVFERLSLGLHRSQEWERVSYREDLKEIFPAWLRLSQMLPPVEEGEISLLSQIEVAKKIKNKIEEAFLNLFQAHFTGLLAPRIWDNQYQGIIPHEENHPKDISPLFILKRSGQLIRSLFIEEGEQLALLPALPPLFHSGRFINICLEHGDKLDMEWSKKLLHSVIWRPVHDREMRLELQKPIRSFRLRTSLKEKGERVVAGEPIKIKANQTLYLDRFQK